MTQEDHHHPAVNTTALFWWLLVLTVAEVAVGPGKTALAAGELVESILLPARPGRASDAYLRFIPRTEMDIAVVGAGVSLQLDADGREVQNPYMDDFPHDDGDVDLLGGLASFYTGTPGVEMGDFFGSFPDSNGVDRAIDLNLCLQQDTHGQTGGTAGRATPRANSAESAAQTPT